MIYCGVDLGKKGGIVAIDENRSLDLVACHMMPIRNGKRPDYDIARIKEIFDDLKSRGELVVAVEKACIVVVSGRISVASTHLCQGIFEGVLTALDIDYSLVSPREWQKDLFPDAVRGQTKQAAVGFCNSRWQSQSWMPTRRSLKPSDGLCDAGCLSYYIYKKNRQKPLILTRTLE